MITSQIDLIQHEFTFYVCDPDHETLITLTKTDETHYEAHLSINLLLNDKIKKNSILKNDIKNKTKL